MRVRVHATRPLVLTDDGHSVRMVPKGMPGTLTGCRRHTGPTDSVTTTSSNNFIVLFDAHAIGPSLPGGEGDHAVAEAVETAVPEDAVEVSRTLGRPQHPGQRRTSV